MPTLVEALLLAILCAAVAVAAAGITVYVLVYRGRGTQHASSSVDAEQHIADINRAAREAMLADVMRRTRQGQPPNVVDGRWQ